MSLDGITTAPDLRAAVGAAAYFRLRGHEAAAAADEVRGVVSLWEREAKALGLSGAEIPLFRNVFENRGYR